MRKFKKIYVETTNICNLNCHFCPKTSRELKFMNSEDFEKIIDKIKMHTKYIYLHLMGEPFLNSNLKEFLCICEKNDIKVNITTNGTLIDKVKEILISSKSVRQVNFSVHSFEANEEKYKFEEYIKNIIDFIKEAKQKSNIISVLRLWNLDSVYVAENKMNVSIFDTIRENFDLESDLKSELQVKNSFKIDDNIYINMGEKFKWPSLNDEKIYERAFCYALRDHVGILVDGTVVP